MYLWVGEEGGERGLEKGGGDSSSDEYGETDWRRYGRF
jgi:hypothetical protein